MRINQKELEEFKQIYFKEFGVTLDNSEAMEKALNVLSGVEMILEFNQNPVSHIDIKNERTLNGK